RGRWQFRAFTPGVMIAYATAPGWHLRLPLLIAQAHFAQCLDRVRSLYPARSGALSLPKPLQQCRHVNQVGLVGAGERVHDDVYAGAERPVTLALAAGHHGIERLVAVIERPRRGEIVRREQNRAHAVAAARLPALIAVARRLGFDPQLSSVPSAGEAAQEVE